MPSSPSLGTPLPYLLRKWHSISFATFYCRKTQVQPTLKQRTWVPEGGIVEGHLRASVPQSLRTLLKEAPQGYTELLGALHSTSMWVGEIRSPVWPVHEGVLNLKQCPRASLVAQWLRICLPMQGTQVRALVWEDPTCRGAAGPVSHNCWACASGAGAPQQERPPWWEAHAPWWRVAPARRN